MTRGLPVVFASPYRCYVDLWFTGIGRELNVPPPPPHPPFYSPSPTYSLQLSRFARETHDLACNLTISRLTLLVSQCLKLLPSLVQTPAKFCSFYSRIDSGMCTRWVIPLAKFYMYYCESSVEIPTQEEE